MTHLATKLTDLESQLAGERLKLELYEDEIARMPEPRDPLTYSYWQRRKLASYKAEELLATKIESLRERMRREELTKTEGL
jgi:hypothetical protein